MPTKKTTTAKSAAKAKPKAVAKPAAPAKAGSKDTEALKNAISLTEKYMSKRKKIIGEHQSQYDEQFRRLRKVLAVLKSG